MGRNIDEVFAELNNIFINEDEKDFTYVSTFIDKVIAEAPVLNIEAKRLEKYANAIKTAIKEKKIGHAAEIGPAKLDDMITLFFDCIRDSVDAKYRKKIDEYELKISYPLYLQAYAVAYLETAEKEKENVADQLRKNYRNSDLYQKLQKKDKDAIDNDAFWSEPLHIINNLIIQFKVIGVWSSELHKSMSDTNVDEHKPVFAYAQNIAWEIQDGIIAPTNTYTHQMHFLHAYSKEFTEEAFFKNQHYKKTALLKCEEKINEHNLNLHNILEDIKKDGAGEFYSGDIETINQVCHELNIDQREFKSQILALYTWREMEAKNNLYFGLIPFDSVRGLKENLERILFILSDDIRLELKHKPPIVISEPQVAATKDIPTRKIWPTVFAPGPRIVTSQAGAGRESATRYLTGKTTVDEAADVAIKQSDILNGKNALSKKG